MNKHGGARRFLAALALSLACTVFPTLALAQAAPPLDPPATGDTQAPGFFGALSDIHFNPFYDPALVDRLAAASRRRGTAFSRHRPSPSRPAPATTPTTRCSRRRWTPSLPRRGGWTT